jgi:metal transporter CNNM
MTLLTWIGIALCLVQSATFSGLNLAFFTIGKLELELEARKGNPRARRVLALRQDSNLLLVTILWGNVAVNVLLALLSGSVMGAVAAFLFSTVIITLFAEIMPQAFFSRHALAMASGLAPLIRFYQLLLWPVTRPTAWVLDRWLGPEAIPYFKERDLHQLIRLHMESTETEIDWVEGRGAMNFLTLDDVPLGREGEVLDPDSIITLPFHGRQPIFPEIERTRHDDFLRSLQASGRSRVVVVDNSGEPRLVIDTDSILRAALFDPDLFNPLAHCHRPIVVRDPATPLGEVIGRFRVRAAHREDDVLDEDVILLWGEERRILTGSDVLGRLLRGIVLATPEGISGPAPRP